MGKGLRRVARTGSATMVRFFRCERCTTQEDEALDEEGVVWSHHWGEEVEKHCYGDPISSGGQRSLTVFKVS